MAARGQRAMVIYGVQPTLEALRAGRVTAIALSARRPAGLAELLRLAERQRVQLRWVERAGLDRLAGGGVHQGVVATVRSREACTVADLVAGGGPPLIVVLDGVEDPRNLGAIARAAEAAGAAGLILPTRRAAPLSPVAVKASAGALAHLPVAPVVNVARALDELKKAGVWTVGLDAGGDRALYDVDLRLPVALVVGAEGRGLRRLVRERCDWLAALPMRGQVASLNAAVAAGVALFEAVRQRAAGAPGARGDPGGRPGPVAE